MIQLIPILLLVLGPIPTASEALKSDLELVKKARNDVVRCQNNERSDIAKMGHFMAKNKNASNMRELNYKLDLETLAVNFLSRRPLGLTKEDRLNGFTFFQTTGLLNDSALALADCEARKYQAQMSPWSPNKLTKPNFDVTGNWFQMIWAKSSRIGCASQQYLENRKTRTVLVCKYDVPMEIGKEIYKVGQPCSGCEKMKTRCDYLKMLCILG